MRVTLFESISINGMMGRPDGRGDFFSEHCWTGFLDVLRATGAMIWGRRTHDAFGRAIQTNAPDVSGVVLTRDPAYAPGPGWRIAASPSEALRVLEEAGVAHTLVVGGQSVNTAFARERRLDALLLFVESVVIGPGMPLFNEEPLPDMRLRLLDVARPTETVLRLHYEVLRA